MFVALNYYYQLNWRSNYKLLYASPTTKPRTFIHYPNLPNWMETGMADFHISDSFKSNENNEFNQSLVRNWGNWSPSSSHPWIEESNSEQDKKRIFWACSISMTSTLVACTFIVWAWLIPFEVETKIGSYSKTYHFYIE